MRCLIEPKREGDLIWRLHYSISYATIQHMNSLQMAITSGLKRSRKIQVELDADQFERLAANFGLFNPEFLESIERAEKDYREGRARTVASLKELRKK